MMRFLKACAATIIFGAFMAGCGGGGGGSSSGGGGSSSGGVAVDTTPPSVVYTTPVNNEPSVGTNAKITVTFSEDVKPATVTKDSFTLVKTTSLPGTPVTLNTTDVGYDATNRIATITPPSPLEAGEQYTITVNPNIVRDLSDNTMASYDWTFTTAAGADVTAPVLLSKAPADGATNVGTNTVIAMSFSKPMDITTFSQAFSLKQVYQLVPAVTVGIPIEGTFALIGQVVVFTPDTSKTPIMPGATYTATLTTETKDLTGNPLAAPVEWTFTTGLGPDATPPKMLAVSPSDGARNVPVNSSISVTFDEPFYPVLFGTIDGKLTKVDIDYTTNTATMTPTTPLKNNLPETRYTTRITAYDLARNISSTYTWSFWTTP